MFQLTFSPIKQATREAESLFSLTGDTTKNHFTGSKMPSSISCNLSSHTEPNNIESISQIFRTTIIVDDELYKLSNLGPHKPSVSSSLTI